jgi:carbon storage regulator CsrA
MLVLTRKTTEKIQIGENIVLTILRVRGQAVRVGIEAPREVRVLRCELPAKLETPFSETDDRPEPANKVAGPSRNAPLASLMAAVHAG